MTSAPISLVLPAFNEEQNLAATVNRAVATLYDIGADFEILIVDDGSTDNTPQVCRELMALHSSVRVIRHGRNRGYGAALRTGFDSARRDLVFLTDADGQFRFDQLPEFVGWVDTAEAVIGYRVKRQDPWHRKLNSRVGNWFARTWLGVQARDINCGYKLLRRDALRRLSLHCDGAMISAELLALASQAGWNIKELPVVHFPRRLGEPTGARVGVIVRTIVEFFQFRRRLVRSASSQSLVSLEATEL